MDKQYQVIRKEVKSLLKERGIYKKATIDELTVACFDDYKMALDSGIAEEEALQQSLSSLKETLDDYKVNKKKEIPFRYSLVLSIMAFVIALVVAIIERNAADVDTCGVIYPILLLLSLIVLVYTICSFKKRNALDYVISILLFIAALSIFIQGLICFYRWTTPDFYYSLWYDFPGVLTMTTMMRDSADITIFRPKTSETLFDPTLIVSFVCLIVSVIASIVKGVRKKWLKK